MTSSKGKSGAGGPLRITRLVLDNWRNFTHVDVALAQRVFLAGPNAAGKSNLLDAIRFLHDIVDVGGGFQASVQRRGGVSRLRSLAARKYPDVAVQVSIGTDDEPGRWEYRVAFGQDNQRRPLVKEEIVKRAGSTVFHRPEPADEVDSARLGQTGLEQVNVNRDFRPVVDFLVGIRYLHIVPQLVREPDRSIGRTNDPYGGDFLEQVARTPAQTQRARLRRIQEALRFAVPQLKELDLIRDERGAPHLRGRYEHWRPQGAWQTEEQFSDGTLRLMGLLWALLDGSGPLLLEEPELSLHPDVVRFLPQAIGRVQRRSGRQVIVSSHSTDLLSDPGIGLDEVLLLIPDREGTRVRAASGFTEIPLLLRGGSSLADAVIPRTRPQRAEQLALFGD